MFLSNRQAAALAILLVIFGAAGCSWLRESASSGPDPGAVSAPDSGIPFATKEPDTYQADYLTIAEGVETRSRYARKGGLWRFDSFDGDAPWRSVIRGDALTYIDHRRKVYSVPPASGSGDVPSFVDDLTTSLLRPTEAAKFEKAETDGNIEQYKVRVDGASDHSTIFYDTSINMVVRHEFAGGFAFEMRNFTLNVDEAIFRLPNGYRKVSWPEYTR